MRDIKFKFVLKNEKSGRVVVSDPYELSELYGYEKVYEDLEEKYGCDGNCTNESVNHCECGGVFDDYEIKDRLEFTGLQDKNGKEIYEGDIVKQQFTSSAYHISKVIFKGGCFLLNHDIDHSGLLNSANEYCDNREIIGNIYENPELLETPITEK